MGFSLDNLSMMALILSIGFVVDDAIVMLENIVRHMELGESPLEAALAGSKEIGFTIVSMTVSLAAVFIPILFMSGILGRLFREFAVTIMRRDSDFRHRVGHADADAVQPLPARERPPGEGPVRRLHGAGVQRRCTAAYERSLRLTLRHRPAMLLVFVAVLAATVRMFGIVPKGFIPDQDNDSMNINLRAAQGTSYFEMVEERQAGRRDRRAGTRTSTRSS